MSNQITVEQVVNVLEATLKPESVKKAQDELLRLAAIPGMFCKKLRKFILGFARSLLHVMCSENYPNHIRNASSVALKNFVRANWAGDGEAPLAEDEREELRNALLATMFQVNI